MHREERRSVWIYSLVLFVVPLVAQVHLVHGQTSEEGMGSPEAPEAVVQFYKDLTTLYMDNDVQIDQLTSMRDAGAEADAVDDLEEQIRNRTRDQLSDLAETARTVEWNHRASVVQGMNKLVEMYDIYIEKVLSGWEPSREDLRYRRRYGQNELIRKHPESASPSLIRRVFLGELLSGISVLPQMQDWFEGKIRRVQDWIGKKYDDLFRTFVDLFSRVSRVVNSEDVDEAERERVIATVRDEWSRFWGDAEGDAKWREIRGQTNRLLSLFRDRSNRLPGAQDDWKQMISDLKRQIGQLQRMQVQKPFMNEERRLNMLLRLGKAFALRVRALENNPTISISKMASSFISNLSTRSPEEYWVVQNQEQLQQKRERLISVIEGYFGDLNKIGMGTFMDDYEAVPEQYQFPVEDVRNIARRLSAFYGKKQKMIGQKVLRLTNYVEARYVLATDGIALMKEYRNALQQQDHDSPRGYVQFEQQFRRNHQSRLQDLSSKADVLDEMDQNLEQMINSVVDVNPEEHASAYFKKADQSDSNQEKQQ